MITPAATVALVAAITAFYHSNDTVQKVVDYAQCSKEDPKTELLGMLGALNQDDAEKVVEIHGLLYKAYMADTTEASHAQRVFCAAAGER